MIMQRKFPTPNFNYKFVRRAAHALFSQVLHGTKHVFLFPPGEKAKLYPPVEEIRFNIPPPGEETSPEADEAGAS